jgi:CreA protein
MQASIACVITGPPTVTDLNAIKSKDGQELFAQGRQLNFLQQKSLRVRRMYDEKHDTVVYVAYSTRLTSASGEGGASTGRYKCEAVFWRIDVAEEMIHATALPSYNYRLGVWY